MPGTPSLRRRDNNAEVCTVIVTARRDGESGTVLFVGTIDGARLGDVIDLNGAGNLKTDAPGCGDRVWLDSPKGVALPVSATVEITFRASASPDAEAPDVDWGRLNPPRE